MSDRLSSLRQQDQIRVIARVFQKLLMAFGNQLLSKWAEIDMRAVYADWAEELQSLSLGAINHGIAQSKALAHPPSQGEFKALCQSYKPAMPIMIDCKLSFEQIEANRKRIAGIAEMLAWSKSA